MTAPAPRDGMGVARERRAPLRTRAIATKTCAKLLCALALAGEASFASAQARPEHAPCDWEPTFGRTDDQGLSAASGPVPGPRAAPIAPLALTLRAPRELRPGQPFELAVGARNLGDTRLTLATEPELHVLVQPDGSPEALSISQPHCGVSEPTRGVVLESGEDLSDAFSLPLHGLPSGQYRLWVVLRSCGRGSLRAVVASPSIEIRVTGAPFTLVAARLSLEEPLVEGMSSADVRAGLESARAALTACFGRVGAPPPEGSIEAEWRVNADGTVRSARIANATLTDARVQGCVLRQLRRVVFDPGHVAHVRQLIRLVPTAIDSTAPDSTRVPALGQGWLSVSSTPIAARLFVDGRDAGETPVLRLPVSAGRHTLELRSVHYGAHRRVVVVRPSRCTDHRRAGLRAVISCRNIR